MIKKLYNILLISLVILISLITPSIAWNGSTGTFSTDYPITQIRPSHKAVSFQQVTFDFEVGRISGTDWGQFQVNSTKLNNFTKACSGYINVFLQNNLRSGLSWVVENMFIPADEETKCLTVDKKEIRAALRKDPFNSSARRFMSILKINRSFISSYFDLRPGDIGEGTVASVLATVLFSRQPLPIVADIMALAEAYEPAVFNVKQVIDNAEGDLSGSEEPTAPSSAVVYNSELVGFPPPETTTFDPFPDLLFPIEVIQTTATNINAGLNQCVPMAHANALQYLENRYNNLPLVWSLPHPPVRGIGKVSAAGDVLFWEPIPSWSLVANVDTYTRRNEVKNMNTGLASSRCKNIRGVMGYLAEFGESAQVVFRHQGVHPSGVEVTYGDKQADALAKCDSSTINLGGYTSTSEEENPTWEWIYDQLEKGRSVVMSFSRYDVVGNWKSGHMVRVYGAGRYNNKEYLFTIDDGDQGNNFDGLRKQAWEVADNNQPGGAGIPNERLEMSGTNWEITFAMSMEAKPTLVIP